MAEPSDVERAMERLRKWQYEGTIYRIQVRADVERLLDSHDRLTRREKYGRLSGTTSERLRAEVADLRAKLDQCGQIAAEATLDAPNAGNRDAVQCVWDLRAKLVTAEAKLAEWESEDAPAQVYERLAYRRLMELRAAEARLAELQRENERLQQTLKLHEGPHVTMTTERADVLEKAEAELAAERERRERLAEDLRYAMCLYIADNRLGLDYEGSRGDFALKPGGKVNAEMERWKAALRPATQEPQPSE